MEPSVQFDPGRCVLVLGPQIAAASLALNNDRELGPATTAAAAAALSYAVLFESGMQKMLELDTSQSKEEKLRKQSLLAGAYELDPSFVANTVVESLRGHDKYEQWLTESFNSLYSLPVQNGQGSVIEELRQLQEKGVLLVYTYYDMILDKAMDTAPVLMDTDEDVKNWGSRKMSGILHVHGIHSHSSTVMCDCVNYGKIVGESSAGRRLREICRNRTVIFIGFDGRFYDPLLPKFANAFLHPSHAQSTAGLLLTVTGCPATNHPALLKLKLSTMSEGLSKFLIPTLSPYKPAPREGVDPSKSLNTTLLFADKSSCSDAAEKVKTMPAIKVHQLTISHEQQSHQLLLYLDHEGLRNLWKVLFSPENSSSSLMNSSLHNGLLGVVLDSGVTVWCKPGGNGNNSRLEGGSGSGSSVAGAMEVSSASSSHPTLSTAVSVIGSMWTPIATPSVVSQQQSLKQLVPSTSTRPTLPSPLITSHSSLGLNTKGLTPELPRHVGLLSPHSAHRREIREVRRVQSERSNLSYQDRINEMKASAGKRNGVLVHRESAPEFVYTSEGLIAYRADSISSSHHHHHSSHHHLRHHSPAAAAAAGGSGTQKPSSVSQPSPLVKDGSNLELKIEYIDQFQHGSSSSSSKSTGSGSHPSAIQKMVNPPSLSRGDGASAVERRGSEKRDVLPPGKFTEERQKFIREAMNWSKKVSTDIHKLSGTPSQQQQQLSLNSSRSSLSLNTNISPEEQEKMLQQHFNLVKSQSQTKLALPAVSSVTSAAAVAAAAMSRLPLSSLASLSPSSGGQPQAQPRAIVMGTPAGVGGAQTPSKSPHPSPHPSPNLSPLQLASAIAANSSSMGGAGGGPSGSPKKSPVNPLLLGGTTGSTQPQSSSGNSSNIFSYFSSNPAAAAAAAALQSPAASFLYNPAVSQYAAAAAAMFNPFQAAVQLLSPQQQQQQQQQQTPGSNNKPPMLLTDPLILQNLQQSLPEKVPLILPDGSITLVPTNFGAAQTPVAAAQLPSATTVGGATATTSRESPVPSTMSLKSPNNVFGVSGSDLKRMRSPDDDPEVRPAPPKRRRSSSLPDIAQLSQLEMRGVQQESIREDEERENERGGEGNGSGSSKLSRPQMLMKQPQHRQTPPPNMIQIPHQDMKLNDPMLGFPTPPQSSPLIGNFAISPFVLSTPTFQNATPMTPVTPGQEPLSTEELRELVEASGGGQTNLPPSPEGTTLPPFPAGRGPIQLWQFLLDLLLSPDKQHMIQWTGNGYEFRILAPEDIAKLWGARKNKPRMNYDKLSRGLRYYYSKGIMDKVPGKKLTFKYTCDVQHYVRSRNIQAMRSSNFPNGGGGGTPTPTGPAGSAGNTIGGIVVGGVSSTHQATATTPLMPGGITIAASAVTVDDGSKPSPHQRLDSASLGSPEADDEREPMNLIMSQTSSMCNKSDTEYAT